jgi:L-threonylcarbamoyladenylate synthase
MALIGTDIKFAKILLTQGDLVAIPTETVYGLAANAFDAAAVAKIYTTKERPTFDPLIVHTDSLVKVQSFVNEIPEMALQLANKFWPGPLTLLLKKKSVVSDLVTAGLDTVAVRIPRHALTKSLLSQLDFPLAAPSANPFGYISPTTSQHVADQLGDKIGYILEGGASDIGVESTIIGFEDGQAVVHRLGGMSVEEIEEVTGLVKLLPHSSSNPTAPGMLDSHYAPAKALVLGDIPTLVEKYKKENLAILAFQETPVDQPHYHYLSQTGDLTEAAQNLFSKLRALDKLPIDKIIAERVPDHGLGRAINDRLSRAAFK